MKNFPIIGFEGIHRVGKGTQTILTKEHFQNLGYETLIVRGEGTRKGKGTGGLSDPESIWWQEQYLKLKEKTDEGYNTQAWREASRRINRELFVLINRSFPKHLEDLNKKGLLLLDRSILSKLFFERQRSNNVDINTLLTFYQGKNGKGKEREKIIPDLTFVFQAKTQTLLDRFEDIEDDKQNIFRRDIVITYNDLFNKIISDIPEQLRNKFIVINVDEYEYLGTEDSIKTINERITSEIENLIQNFY